MSLYCILSETYKDWYYKPGLQTMGLLNPGQIGCHGKHVNIDQDLLKMKGVYIESNSISITIYYTIICCVQKEKMVKNVFYLRA